MPSHTLSERRKRGLPSPRKAGMILEHGEVRGHPLTMPQKGLMGLIRGGGTPSRMKKRHRKMHGKGA